MTQFRLYLPSDRRQWLSIFPTNFSRYPLMLPRFGMSSSGSVIAVKIYRGKLKCHGIIARSEAIKIPDSKLQTIKPRDRDRPDYCVPPDRSTRTHETAADPVDYDIPPNF